MSGEDPYHILLPETEQGRVLAAVLLAGPHQMVVALPAESAQSAVWPGKAAAAARSLVRIAAGRRETGCHAARYHMWVYAECMAVVCYSGLLCISIIND